jgi:uncharacterized protein with HEPN domain
VRDVRPLVLDILQALERVEEIGRKGRGAFFTDWVLQDAAVRNFEILGEAAKRAQEQIGTSYPRIPWVDLAGFRDVLAHQYFRVDLEIVWAMIETRVSPLRVDVATILADLGEPRT